MHLSHKQESRQSRCQNLLRTRDTLSKPPYLQISRDFSRQFLYMEKLFIWNSFSNLFVKLVIDVSNIWTDGKSLCCQANTVGPSVLMMPLPDYIALVLERIYGS